MKQVQYDTVSAASFTISVKEMSFFSDILTDLPLTPFVSLCGLLSRKQLSQKTYLRLSYLSEHAAHVSCVLLQRHAASLLHFETYWCSTFALVTGNQRISQQCSDAKKRVSACTCNSSQARKIKEKRMRGSLLHLLEIFN